MIFDINAVENLAKGAAAVSNKRQHIYERIRVGGYIFGPDGTLTHMKQYMGVDDAKFVKTIYPEGQEPKE